MDQIIAAGTAISPFAPLLSVFTAVSQFGSRRSAADFSVQEGNIAAQQEELAATQRESDRKERLANALASQNASAGARGVLSLEGSPLTILQEDIRREEVATERDVFSSQLSGMTAKIRARNQAAGIKSSANIGLITSLADVAKTLPAGK